MIFSICCLFFTIEKNSGTAVLKDKKINKIKSNIYLEYPHTVHVFGCVYFEVYIYKHLLYFFISGNHWVYWIYTTMITYQKGGAPNWNTCPSYTSWMTKHFWWHTSVHVWTLKLNLNIAAILFPINLTEYLTFYLIKSAVLYIGISLSDYFKRQFVFCHFPRTTNTVASLCLQLLFFFIQLL